MTRVCLVGEDDVELRYELLSRETSREALSTYDLRAPYANTIGAETVSLGAAVSLLNDLNWYLVRFVADALVLEPSIDDEEWLSRELARAIRDEEVHPDDTGRLLKVYGVERPEIDEEPPAGGSGPATTDSPATADSPREPGDSEADDAAADDGAADESDLAGGEGDGDDDGEEDAATGGLPRLVEPMYVSRTGPEIPEYDIRDVDDTLVVRVTEREFEA